MTKVPVIIAGGLEVRVDDLPAGAFELIKTALLVWNEDRQKKLDEKIWGAWNEPEWIPLYREEHRRDGSHVLLMPRGFASQLNYGLAQFGCEVEWADMRSTADAEPGYYVPFVLRDYQIDAAIKLLQAEQGVYESPAGSGKTWTVLGGLAWADQRAIVIVDRANLLEQWRHRAHAALGLSLDLSDPRSVGKIGEDVWEERDLTIALRQSLWSRLWEVQATGMFKRYGAVVIDECHHSSATTLREIVSEAQTRLLWGVSATPAKTETKGKIVYSTIGPIVARTSREELYERDVLVKPSVELIFTGHDDVFWVTHDATRAKIDGQMVWRCDVPDCRKAGSKHGHRNNYSSVKKHLVENEERAAIIAERVVSERGHVHLVASSELKHLDILRAATEAAGWDGPIFMLRGEENAEGLSQDIATAIEEGGFWETYEAKEKNPATGRAVKVTKLRRTSHDMPHGREAVIFSTVAGEGLDIPPIDRVHVSFPMRQEAAVIQLIGRGERTAPGKTDSVIIDYRDSCSVFAEQGLERERVFRYLGLTIKEGRRAEAA